METRAASTHGISCMESSGAVIGQSFENNLYRSSGKYTTDKL